LAHALQEKGKPFEMMIYPEGAHGIGGPRARCHLFRMITRFFAEPL
jgi:dipeptidyl aminopeptidase/acylaminoacyl peptidase